MLGAGGMGGGRARDTRLKRDVALKCCRNRSPLILNGLLAEWRRIAGRCDENFRNPQASVMWPRAPSRGLIELNATIAEAA